MLEAKRRGNVASVIANLEKEKKNSFQKKHSALYGRSLNKQETLSLENSESSDAQEKESETDSEKEHRDELEEINNSSLNTIREEKETGSEVSVKKTSGEDDSSLEDSTIKQTWSGSYSPGILNSGSDFSSTEDEYEDEGDDKKDGSRREEDRGKGNKRNSITKGCNSDFHWVIGEKHVEPKPLFDTGQSGKNEVENLKYFERSNKTSGLNPFYSMDRDRKCLDFSSLDTKIEQPVQLRLPPQSPGSLDRKRLPKSRLERDQKCKSSVISRSPQSARKALARSFVEEINLSAFPESRKHDYSGPREDWQQYFSEDNEKCCQHFRNVHNGHGCCNDHCGFHHHYHQVYQPPCRSFYGSCESLAEKANRKSNFGSQRSLYEERGSRKSSWQESQQRSIHGSNEYLPYHCQYDREKSCSWRILGKSGPELEERLIRLENDKESLQLQVSVLTEQVEAQNEKIMDLQQSLDDKKQQLTNTEDLLQREILTRSSLETQKLELMSAISELKLQHASVERENYELKEEKKRLQNVKPPMMPRNTSPALLQSTPVSSSRYSPNDYSVTRKSASPSSNQNLYNSDSFNNQSNSFSEPQKYGTGSTYNNAVLSSPSSGSFGGSQIHKHNNKYSSSNGNLTLHAWRKRIGFYLWYAREETTQSKLNILNETSSLLCKAEICNNEQKQISLNNSSCNDSESNSFCEVDFHNSTFQQFNHFQPSPQPNLRRSMDQYNSLPRQKILENQEFDRFADMPGRGVAFGKGLTSMITLKSDKSYSAPNLAETEKSGGDETDKVQNETETTQSTDANQNPANTRKGIKKIFNKIKRSNSGNVNDLLGEGDFKRGGIRATAGPRLGGHIVHVFIPPNKPFSEWDTDSLCGWLEELGLENYVADLRRWVKNGSHFLSASPYELEKELGMKNHLHKKKLLLALQEMSEKSLESDELLRPAGCLDTAWVMRWLDDVGLPQHKEVFLTARIDGRMLHRLTMDDLAAMHITSALHVASLKKGIKVLREHKMDPNCLTRRSVPDEPPPTAADVSLWTNHRVMEWLRIVDLAEYAPNLRGSGVHGALMVYETKFTAELLASLLNIPPNKTLLRRHLNTHFKELLGREVIQAKREAETTLGYIPLTPSAKVKAIKKPQFTLKRKKNKNDVDFGDLVCPLDDGASGENASPTNTCMSANGEGEMKERRHVPDVCPLTDPSPRNSPLAVRLMRI